VPQIGWNAIEDASDPLFRGVAIPTAYFAHGYACRPEDPTLVKAWSRHEEDLFPAALRRSNIFGVQFHPEKSSTGGLALLRAFANHLATTAAVVLDRDRESASAPATLEPSKAEGRLRP
jgi:glutamine amidotransferase